MATNLKGSNHNSEFIELLDALKRYGPRNLSLISMLTGIPRETVRYKVKKQLKNLGFRIQMIPNFYKMGLTRLYAKLTFSSDGLKIAPKILDGLGSQSYLSYYGKIAFSNDYIVLINSPSRWVGVFGEFFDRLKDIGIVENYDVYEIKEVGYPHVTYRFFDFKKGVWSFDGESHSSGEGVVSIQKASKEESTNYLIDSIDLAIITELLSDAFKPLTKLSSITGRDPRLLRYHFQEHVVRKGLIAGYVLSWFQSGDVDAPTLARMWIKSGPNTSRKITELARKIAISPFCKFYQVLEDDTLLIYLLINKQFTPAVRHLSNLFSELGVSGESFIIEDAASFTLTKEMFKDDYGWLKPRLGMTTNNSITETLNSEGGRLREI